MRNINSLLDLEKGQKYVNLSDEFENSREFKANSFL